jgi:hypothetical protein
MAVTRGCDLRVSESISGCDGLEPFHQCVFAPAIPLYERQSLSNQHAERNGFAIPFPNAVDEFTDTVSVDAILS